MLPEKSESPSQQYVAQVLRVPQDGIKATINYLSGLHIRSTLYNLPVLTQVIERQGYEKGCQSQNEHASNTQAEIFTFRQEYGQQQQNHKQY